MLIGSGFPGAMGTRTTLPAQSGRREKEQTQRTVLEIKGWNEVGLPLEEKAGPRESVFYRMEPPH